MLATPTTLVSILRGTTTDTYGDEVDTDTLVYADLPASIMETMRTVFSQDAATPMIVRVVTGRVGGGTDIRVGDRLLDQATSQRYMADSFTRSSSPIHTPDVVLDLRYVS